MEATKQAVKYIPQNIDVRLTFFRGCFSDMFSIQLYDIYAPICQAPSSVNTVDMRRYTNRWNRIVQKYFPHAATASTGHSRSRFYSPPNFPFDPCVSNCAFLVGFADH